LNFLHLFPWLNEPDVLEYLLSRLQVQMYSLNEVVYRQGDEASSLYFLTAGFVQVTNDENETSLPFSSVHSDIVELFSDSDEGVRADLRPACFSPGDMFGQMALLNGEKQLDTARCVSNALVRCRFVCPTR
jgi:CRP-like cAMP-binding protein